VSPAAREPRQPARGAGAGGRPASGGHSGSASHSAAGGAPGLPVHLLLGPEEGQKAEHIEKLRQQVAARSGAQPEVSRFYAGETRMAQILLVARNFSLFSPHRFVVIPDAEEIHRAEDVQALVEYLGSPAGDATLVLACSGYASDVDRRIVAAIPKESQRIFWELFENQKQGWITAFFRQRSISIDTTAVEFILDMVENNTRDLRVECERLAQFFGAGASLGVEDVAQHLYHSKEENVFTLFDRLCERDLAASVETLDKILLAREADATQLATGLLAQFRKLASLKRLVAENFEPSEAFTRLRIMSKRNQRTYQEGSKRFTAGELESVVLLLAAFDERFRTTKADLHTLLLNLLVYYIVMRAGQGAWRMEEWSDG
jgi:DNA polymerase III subunit delta